MLVSLGVTGRSLDAWALVAATEGWRDELVGYVCRQVAPRIAKLHQRGLVYRDLYLNHVFAPDPRGDAPPTFLDVERVFAPRWRLQRWIVKDLAGLWASAPVGSSLRTAVRFLRSYFDGPVRGRRRLLRAIAAKAERVRRHVPRYG